MGEILLMSTQDERNYIAFHSAEGWKEGGCSWQSGERVYQGFAWVCEKAIGSGGVILFLFSMQVPQF